MDMSKNHTENPNHRHPRRSKRYALQGRNILPLHRGAFCQFIFRWIYNCHNSKSTGKETGKTHFCILCYYSMQYVGLRRCRVKAVRFFCACEGEGPLTVPLTHWTTVVPNGLNRPKIRSLGVISRVFMSKFQHMYSYDIRRTFEFCLLKLLIFYQIL